MRILALNCGSSSLRYALGELGEPSAEPSMMLRGAYRGIGAKSVVEASLGPAPPPLHEVVDHRGALEHLVGWLVDTGRASGLDATAHRVVHGGVLRAPVVVERDALAAIEAATELAPLHNGPALVGLEVVRHVLSAPAVAVFDTTFHVSMPPVTAGYAIPGDVAERFGIRRHGFHGLAHRSMLERWVVATGRPVEGTRVVTCQLGSGASLAALRDGRSVDTTMGLTPLEGLMMATRSGDVDPALPGHLVRSAAMTLDDVDDLLSRRSGLLGVSGTSSSVGDLLVAERSGDARAGLALDMFCLRARKHLAACMATLGGADAVVVGGGIGERFPEVRRRILGDMGWCALVLDDARNAVVGEGEISAPGSATAVWVLAPDEERLLVRDAASVIDARSAHP